MNLGNLIEGAAKQIQADKEKEALIKIMKSAKTFNEIELTTHE